MDPNARRLVERFDLEPHPEGGYFREVYRSDLQLPHPLIPEDQARKRCAGTLIYFLLEGASFSAFHRVRWSDKGWHLYAGGPVSLHIIAPNGQHSTSLLSSNFDEGEPTAVVPAGHWQAAALTAGSSWAFGGCTVSPGFEFADFQMPPATELTELFPQHADLIGRLTRS